MSRFVLVKRKTWRHIIGANDNIATEHKIFNSICIFAFVGILLSIVFNLGLSLYTLAVFQAFFLVLLTVIFYFSRVRRKFLLSLFLFAFSNYAFLAINYFYNMGIAGPTLMAFFISFCTLIFISSRRFMLFWVICHISVVAVLSAIEYNYPHLIQSNYISEKSHFFDMNFTFCIVIIITYLIAISTRRRYLQEKNKVSQQNAIIREKNLRLEYIDKERSRLFSIISHDLRSPLTSINGYLELLNSDILTEAEKQNAQQDLLNLSTHTSEMLNNLLHWSKSQLNGNEVIIQNLNLSDALSNTIEIQRVISTKKGIHFLADIPTALTVKADKDYIELVVRNLLSNAIKFTPEGGSIHVKAVKKENKSEISVSDTGIGIEDSRKPYVFTSELKPSVGTENEKGIGLGLVLCKEFVEKQGGTISFETEKGKGTRF